MDEIRLRELLDRAVASEPPMGPIAANSLRAGMKLRRRRRTQGTVACLAAAAAALIGTAAVAGTGTAGNPAAGPAKVTGPSTVYVLSGEGNLYAIPNATKVRGKKILLPGGRQFMAITPNGKTIYVSGDEPNAVIPVSTVTDKVGKPIEFGAHYVPTQILITPNGRTAYVTDIQGGEIYPIATATNTVEKPIRTGPAGGGYYQMAITPDGKTLYAVSSSTPVKGPSDVIPIATATNKPGKPIKIQSMAVYGLIMNPDGATVYAIGGSGAENEIVPISTATNTAGQPSNVGQAGGAMAIAPDGQTLYLVDYGARPEQTGVLPFSTVTNTPGKPIKVTGMVYAIAITPNGNTAYAVSEPRQKPAVNCTGQTGEVTPISTATNLPGRPIRVACDPYAVAGSLDGRTIWVGSRNWVTPISAATHTAGEPIKFRGSLVAMAVAVTP
jgi:DNA-binding beta-propeller fold protein YncE